MLYRYLLKGKSEPTIWKLTMIMSVLVGTLSWISGKKVDFKKITETNFETPKNDRQQVASQLLQWADKEICGSHLKPKNNIAYYKIKRFYKHTCWCWTSNWMRLLGSTAPWIFSNFYCLHICRYIILTVPLNMIKWRK